MTTQELYETLGKLLKDVPTIANREICTASRDADVSKLGLESEDLISLVVSTDDDEFFAVLFHE
jgi:hypothetical protein